MYRGDIPLLRSGVGENVTKSTLVDIKFAEIEEKKLKISGRQYIR